MATASTPLANQLAAGLVAGNDALTKLHGQQPANRRDRFLVLNQIYDLHRQPLDDLGERVKWQHHPTVVAIKTHLETDWIDELDQHVQLPAADSDPAEAMRSLAAHSRAPRIYQWLADEADWQATLHFLALEGGPDDIFDDLVATCQIGLPLGPAKMELAGNYWDEMGNGQIEAVHSVLYKQFVDAVKLPHIPRDEQPTQALERCALLGLLAVNRALQPEMIGALGLIELSAGPQCRYVDQGLKRLGGATDARAFYQMHAVVDPRHGAGWLDNAVSPLVNQRPAWARRILRGAAWKNAVNEAFFNWAADTFTPQTTETTGPNWRVQRTTQAARAPQRQRR